MIYIFYSTTNASYHDDPVLLFFVIIDGDRGTDPQVGPLRINPVEGFPLAGPVPLLPLGNCLIGEVGAMAVA